MTWNSSRIVQMEEIIRFERYTDNDTLCTSCSRYNYTCSTVGGLDLNYCGRCCGKYRQVTAPVSDVPVKTFIRYLEDGFNFPCSNCKNPCSSSKALNGINLHYCASCNLMLERENVRCYMKPYKIVREADKVLDIACSGVFICMLLESNKLVLRNYSSEVEHTEPTETNSKNQTSVIREALYGGGDACLFVKSREGHLHKCSIEASGPRFKLVEVKFPAAVNKVCCGSTTSAALLADGSVWFIADNCKTYRLYHNSGIGNFTDIAVVAMTDIFLVQGGEASFMKMKLTPKTNVILINFLGSDLDNSLKEMVCPKPHAAEIQLTPNLAQFYGKPHLSDLTIKLSDGDFQAHSLILFSTSTHFQDAFGPNNPAQKVLDMSEYNPKAYKCLLQQFYHVKPDDLEADDLIDLRQIAASYGETAIAEAATAKIKEKLNEENVLQICARAKTYDFKDVITECEKIIRSPTFTDRLLQVAMQNLTVQVPKKHD